nr:hypothetical protein [Photobacterium carnosum]
MATLEFKPWEKWLTNLKLRPKLILLMVFSTLLLIGKQLWDAELFYQSVIVTQQDKVQQLAQSNALMLTSLATTNPPFSALNSPQLSTELINHSVYVVEYRNDNMLEKSKINQVINLKQPLEKG